MITALSLILGFVVGQILGRIIFYRRGYNDGHEAGSKSACIPPFDPSPMPVSRSPAKYSFVLQVPVVPKPEDQIRVNTSAAEEIARMLARRLLADRIIRPVILDENDRKMQVGASILVLTNPTYDTYSNLVFFQREE